MSGGQQSDGTESGNQVSRRTVLWVLGASAASAAVAACGTNSSAKTSPAGGSTAGTPVVTAKASGTTGKTTLRYWTFMKSGPSDDPRSTSQGQILDAFRKAHPDINVVEEVVPWQQLQQQLLQNAAAGTAPDVTRQLDSSLGTLVAAGAIIPLDQYVSSWTTAQKQDFLYSWDDTVFNGKKFAFRQSLRIANLNFYRPGMFKKAGINSLPTTLDAYTAAVREVTHAPVSGFLMPLSKSDNINRFMQTMPPMYWALGSDLVDLESGKPTFNSDAGKQLFQWLQDLVYKYQVSPKGEITIDSETAGRQFAGSTLASTWHHSDQWDEWSALAKTPDGLDTTTQPNPANSATPVPASAMGGWTLAMSKGAHQDAAWQLINFFNSKEAEMIDSKVAGVFPTRKSTLSDPFFASPAFARQKKWLEYLSANAHPGTTIKIKGLSTLQDVLGDAAQQIIGNKANVGSVLDNAARQYAAQVKA